MSMNYLRRTSYYETVLSPFKGNNASADVPLLMEGGYSNTFRGQCGSMKDQIEYFKPVEDFTTPLAQYVSPIFNISLSSINTLRVLSKTDVSGLTFSVYQGSFLERPDNDPTKTHYYMDSTRYPDTISCTQNTTTGLWHYVDVINFVALPYVFFTIDGLDTVGVAGYVAGNGLLMYLHTELSP